MPTLVRCPATFDAEEGDLDTIERTRKSAAEREIGAVMKAKKMLKRIAKIEALISEVTKRSSASAPHIQEPLRDAKAAINVRRRL